MRESVCVGGGRLFQMLVDTLARATNARRRQLVSSCVVSSDKQCTVLFTPLPVPCFTSPSEQRQGIKTVQALNLSWNRIDDDGCLPIARLLGPLSQLAINKSVRERAAAALVKVRGRPQPGSCASGS